MGDNDQLSTDRSELEKQKLLLNIRKVEYENEMLKRDIEPMINDSRMKMENINGNPGNFSMRPFG